MTCDKCNAPLTQNEIYAVEYFFWTQEYDPDATWDGFELRMQTEGLSACERCHAEAAMALAQKWITHLKRLDGERPDDEVPL
jgi:hypothetical protein